MSPKKGDAVPQPTVGTEWRIRFNTNEAAKGWQELERQAPGNLRKAWHTMREGPAGQPTGRHHQLAGPLSTATHAGLRLPQWQLEVTSGGRVWYLLDEGHRTVWVRYAGTGHPKTTE
jgi:hypothetical protein